MGIPGIGKSTWIKNHKMKFPGKTQIVSRDSIRFSLLKEGEDYFAHENKVWKLYVDQAKFSIDINDNTILDATHLNEASRSKILLALGDYLKKVDEVNIIYFVGSIHTALKRNCKREGLGLVPVSTIRRMKTQITDPSYKEGFDRIFYVNVDKNDEIIEKVEI